MWLTHSFSKLLVNTCLPSSWKYDFEFMNMSVEFIDRKLCFKFYSCSWYWQNHGWLINHQIAMFLKENRELVLESYKVGKVLDIIVEESMKSRETNDVRAIKCHFLAVIMRLAKKSLKNSEDTLDGFIKRYFFNRH